MPTVFLYLFFVGFGLTIVSALLGVMDVGHGSHGPAGHDGHFGHGHGHAAAGHGHAGPSHGGGVGHLDNPTTYGDTTAVSPINYQTIVAFLMGFGGTGYIVTRLGWAGYLIALPAAGGLVCGWLIFRWFRFLIKGERPLGPTTYTGVVGRLTVGIREGGTGEIVYTQHGTRKVASARSADGTAIAKGVEVVILRYEKGIAYVQPFEVFINREQE